MCGEERRERLRQLCGEERRKGLRQLCGEKRRDGLRQKNRDQTVTKRRWIATIFSEIDRKSRWIEAENILATDL